jgi:hypothetical protein
MNDDFAYAVERMRKAAADLPEVEESTSYGTPALKVRKKFLCRIKDPDTLVLMCPLEEKELLMAAAPDIYYETDHYRGWPAVLVCIKAVSDEELAHRLALTWRTGAEKAGAGRGCVIRRSQLTTSPRYKPRSRPCSRCRNPWR